MPGATRSSHGQHSHPRKSSSSHYHRESYFGPVLNFTVAVLLVILAKFLHAGMVSPALGALGITVLAVSKIAKFKEGIVISGIIMFVMALFYTWQWVDRHFVTILSGEISANRPVFTSVLSEGSILVILAWMYHRQLRSGQIRASHQWPVKKPYVTIFKMLFFFQVFMVLFWGIAFMSVKTQPVTGLTSQDSAIVSGALALLASGIPAIIYLAGSSRHGSKRHRHHHHHTHTPNSDLKNSDLN